MLERNIEENIISPMKLIFNMCNFYPLIQILG